MRINVTEGIKDYEGNVIMTTKMENGHPVLDANNQPVQVVEQLRAYFINALNNLLPNETPVAEDKAQIYYLSVKLFRGKEVDLTHGDIVFIKDRVSKVYGPLIYGRICDLFDGNEPIEENVEGKNAKKENLADKNKSN